MQVPLLDLKLQYQALKETILPEITSLIESQSFILGPKVEAFEKAVGDYCKAPHAIGASSGTDALLLILMALEIGSGDAVITTPYTFFATAGGIARTGADPVFIDIDPDSYNLSTAHLEKFLQNCKQNANGHLLSPGGKRIRAIMPVHLFGQCAEMDAIIRLGEKYRLPIIEDAAQALGTQYPTASGIKKAGAMGEFGYFSFFPSKNLGGFGDGGMVVCKEEKMAKKMIALRNHGMEERYYHSMIGGNFRLDTLQAAVLHIKLPYLDTWASQRQANARFYKENLKNLPQVTLPSEVFAESDIPYHHTYNQFVIRAEKRDALSKFLADNQIGNAIYYPVPLHLQECFKYLGYKKGDFPESEKAANETLALPIFPELTQDQLGFVVSTITKFYSL